MQTLPGHTFSQLPQLDTSVSVSTHPVEQITYPNGHWHVPPIHGMFPGHTFPQLPQCSRLLLKSTTHSCSPQTVP